MIKTDGARTIAHPPPRRQGHTKLFKAARRVVESVDRGGPGGLHEAVEELRVQLALAENTL